MKSKTDATDATDSTDQADSDSKSGENKDGSRRLATPPLTDIEKEQLQRYCIIYHHRLGPGLLMAAMREVRRELGIPEIPPPTPPTEGA